ncbi:MAG: thioredoxin family protein [Saprospiraceae bacterium]|nr:thioredoxin family protein [Saprospiraceae bacterium]
MRLILSAIFFFFIISFNLKGQDSPVKYTWEAKLINESEYEITFKAKIQEGWYTYSQYLESDDGPIPTTIFFESANEKKVGKATENTSKPEFKISGFDKMFEMNITKYKKDLEIKQKFKVTDASKPVSGYLEYMTCDDTKCMPPTAVEFTFIPSELKSNASNNNLEIDEETLTEDDETDDNNTDTSPKNPVSWTINFNKVSDKEVDLVATATIAEGWYVYSQTLESDDGPVPTSINYEDSANIEWGTNLESATVPENKLKMLDEVFEMELTKFKHDFTITQRLKIKDLDKPVTGFLEYMTCDATKCMPPTAVDFTFNWNGNNTNSSNQGTVVDGKFDPKRPELIRTNKSPIGNCEDNSGQEINNNDNIAGMSLLTIFILGFGGGLLALLTPCVFPMIPMTVSLFSKGKDKSKKEGIKNAVVFGLSIIVIYVSLGLFITLTFGADALNLLSTHWVMNLAFFLLFTVFAISFFGYFEITLPSSWANKADAASGKGGLIGTFFGAFSISLVSFSCTGPIVGTLLVQAAVNGGVVGPTIGMLGFSIALALPFTFFAAFPSWLKSLPNSGSWMTTMKVVLGFLELALGLKFLSTADLTEHWGILPYELFVGLWGLIFLAMTLYLFGFIHFPHDNPKAKISYKRKGLAAFSGLLTISIFSGFLTNPKTQAFKTPSWLSGLAPSACYSYIKPCPKPEDSEFKFSDHCPPGIKQCFDDYDEAMKYAKVINRPVLIDFTGYGCVNCRKMEENVWIDDEVSKILNEEFILVSLYVDDRQKLEQTLEGPNGTKIRNVGNKWAAFQEVNFDRQSQPYYVLVSPDEKVLNTPKAYTPDIPTYTRFLKCGVETFKNSQKE